MAPGPHFSLLLITVQQNLIKCCHCHHLTPWNQLLSLLASFNQSRQHSTRATAPWVVGRMLEWPSLPMLLPYDPWQMKGFIPFVSKGWWDGGTGAAGEGLERKRSIGPFKQPVGKLKTWSLSLIDSNNNHNSHLGFQRVLPASAHLGPSISSCLPSCQKGNCSQRQWCPEAQTPGIFLVPPSLTFPCPHPAFHGFMTRSQRGMWIFTITYVSKQSCFYK